MESFNPIKNQAKEKIKRQPFFRTTDERESMINGLSDKIEEQKLDDLTGLERLAEFKKSLSENIENALPEDLRNAIKVENKSMDMEIAFRDIE
ncbi:MAG: hypothetical protein NT091_04650 [Candidatus Falkowbacteria bacterium]|nr:hypothetical protein [Candidatus Falkowbacteria bacterium]